MAEFNRAIEILKLLALTLPAITIYMQILSRRADNPEIFNVKDIETAQKYAGVSLFVFILSISLIVVQLALEAGSIKTYSQLGVLATYLIILAYSFWGVSVFQGYLKHH